MKTFLTLFVLLLIIVLFVGGYYGSIIFYKNIQADRAVTMSEKYVANLYSEYHIIGKNCQGEDTNSDLYISCDIRIIKGEESQTERVLNLSCPTLWKSFTGSTCKERLVLPTN